jgi:hypothetical protein
MAISLSDSCFDRRATNHTIVNGPSGEQSERVGAGDPSKCRVIDLHRVRMVPSAVLFTVLIRTVMETTEFC